MTPLLKAVIVINAIILALNTFFFIINIIKENKLNKALDHFELPKTITERGVDITKNIVDTIFFEQHYNKDIQLKKAVESNAAFLEKEIVKILAEQLVKNKSVHIKYEYGEDTDIIKAHINYLAPFK